MAEFLKAFIPTFAFMLVPLMIPLVAVAVGRIRDLATGESRAEAVDDRVRARLEQREVAQAA